MQQRIFIIGKIIKCLFSPGVFYCPARDIIAMEAIESNTYGGAQSPDSGLNRSALSILPHWIDHISPGLIAPMCLL